MGWKRFRGLADGNALYKIILLISIIVLLMVIFPIIEKIITALVIQETLTCSNCTDCNSKMQDNRILQLSQSITSTGACINITASNVTIDCQGFSITGSNAENGIENIGFNNMQIKNCIIQSFSEGISLQYSNNSYVINTSATSVNRGLHLLYSNYNNVINSTFVSRGSNNRAVYMEYSSYNNLTNVIGDGSALDGWGIILESYSSNNYIKNSRAKGNAVPGFMNWYSSSNNTFENSYAESAYGEGVNIAFSSYGFRLINSTAKGTSLYGVYIRGGAGNAEIINSTLIGGTGLYIDSTHNNIVINSIISGAPAVFISSGINNTLNDSTLRSGKFSSSGGSGNVIKNMTFNSSNFPTSVSFTYSGNIQIDASNGAGDSYVYSIGKYLEITNQSAASMQLNISYDSHVGVVENSLRMYRYNGTEWLPIPGSSVDTVNNIVSAAINSFSIFAPMGNSTLRCSNLTSPNSVYYLENNISASGTCFNIQASNITLDCQEFSIKGNNAGTGININASNSLVKRCGIYNFSMGINISYSNNNQLLDSAYLGYIDMENASNNKILNSSADLIDIYGDCDSNTFNVNGNSIKIWGGSDSNIVENSNMPQGVNILATLVRGPSNSNKIINSTIGRVEISSSENNEIINCNITSNGTGVSIGEGIPPFSSRNNRISDSRINGTIGIYLGPSQSTTILNTVITSTSQDFVSTSRGNDIITNLTFNSSGCSVKTSLAYSGSISITSANASAPDSDNLLNISKYLNITNQSSAVISLNISYSIPDLQGITESTLKIYKHNGTDWLLVPGSSVDAINKIVNASISSFSLFGIFGQDISAPVITIIAPANNAQLSSGTTQTYINISTDEIAECRYNQTGSDFNFSNGISFNETNSTSHSFLLSGLSDGNSYVLYYKCSDSSGNANENSTSHSFSVASVPSVPPAGGAGSAGGGVRVCTDECISGAKECASASSFRTCADYDSDTCTEWQITICMSGEVCNATTSECIQLPSPPKPECALDSDCPSGKKCIDGKCETVPTPLGEIEKPAFPLINYAWIALTAFAAVILLIIIRDIFILRRKIIEPVKKGVRHMPKRKNFPEIRS